MTEDRLTPQEACALDWCLRRQQPGWSAEDAAAFKAWLEASPLHTVAYLRIERGWARAEKSINILAPRSEAPVKPAASASSPLLKGSEPFNLKGSDPFKAPRPVRRGRRPLAWAAALAVLAIGGALAMVLPTWEPAGQYTTEVGSRRTVMLEDGSRVELNTDTRIRAFFEEGTRQVHLVHGEAYFDVRADPARPFIVHADGQRIVVLGTRFMVRREAQRLHVVVTEGKVRIDPLPRRLDNTPTPPVIASRGDSVLVDQRSALVTSLPEERLDSELAWRTGFLMFDDIPLSQVAAEFNRYNRRKLVVDDRAAATIRISGSFESTNLDAFLRLLRQGYHLDVEERGSRVRISA